MGVGPGLDEGTAGGAAAGSGSDSDEGNNSDEELRARRAKTEGGPAADATGGEEVPAGQTAADEDGVPGVDKVIHDSVQHFLVSGGALQCPAHVRTSCCMI